ncbi:MAG: hypothetical protein AAGF04_01330 [Chlamydiota bacterium]
MMRFLLAFFFLFSPLSAYNSYPPLDETMLHTRGEAAISSSVNLVAYSMVAWGVIIGVSAAILTGVFQGSRQ